MVTVYTVLFGDYAERDSLYPPPVGCRARYVCFADGPVKAHGWEVLQVPPAATDPRLRARLYKMRPDRWFGATVTTLWMDASCQLIVSAEWIARHRRAPVMGFQHPKRRTVADEGAVIRAQGFAPADKVTAQLEAYEAEGFPLTTPKLTTTGFLLRSPEALVFNRLWERQILTYTMRDQLSVNYCGWATQTAIRHWSGSYLHTPYMIYHRHRVLA